MAFHPEDLRLFTTGQDNCVKVWNLHSSKEVATLSGLQGYASSVTFTNDGNNFIAGLRNGQIMVWSLKNNAYKHLVTVETEEEEVTALFYWN